MIADKRFRIGLVINPFAGIGGALALKGSDGKAIREQAMKAGAKQLAMEKAKRALTAIQHHCEGVEIFTANGDMGEWVCKELSLPYEVVYHSNSPQTEAEDTEKAVQQILTQSIDVLVFAGGDGTARNIYRIAGDKVPVIGVPAGCKIHSGVYAVSPNAAGEVLNVMISGQLVSEKQGEVRDIDEGAFRAGKVLTEYFGEMRVPNALEYIQAVKMGGKESEELLALDIAAFVGELMEEEPTTYFVMGSGSTVANIMEEQGYDNTLLGVDVVKDGELVASDVNAQYLEQLAQIHTVKIIVTVIGGQGHIFGRGNQQLSPAFIAKVGKQNIWIVATKAKLQGLNGSPMRLDSSDEQLDKALAGQFSVITGYNDRVLYPAK